MLTALRSGPVLVEGLLGEARKELTRKREIRTWEVLASLAERTRKLPDAETYFRQCLVNVPVEHEAAVYDGLLRVLMRQKKFTQAVTVCEAAMTGPRPARNTHAALFESKIASALAAQGKYDDALPHIDKAIRLSSRPPR